MKPDHLTANRVGEPSGQPSDHKRAVLAQENRALNVDEALRALRAICRRWDPDKPGCEVNLHRHTDRQVWQIAGALTRALAEMEDPRR